MSGRPTTSSAQRSRIDSLLETYTTSLELEIQQRAVEFESLLHLGEIRVGVLERMPPPELKATVMGIGKLCNIPKKVMSLIKGNCVVVENKPVGSTSFSKDVSEGLASGAIVPSSSADLG